ncbi:hypothetical protein ZIOFF_060547 [Zingiber officinale]|uniref:14-3-3 domain-containing protein n=1 Tax=Zingiber officinale TaxID=94328 RepID=A0A8J5FAY5_ZINOF|nr:hypothetical protein ZIOFF_060547 [Zingiber officinale]
MESAWRVNNMFGTGRKGDYSRYLAEFKTGEEKQKAADQSMKAYEACQDPITFIFSILDKDLIAYEKAKINLLPTHPIRLGLALNFSVLYYEILNSPDRACYLAKQAFDLAVAEQDNSSEEPHEDSALIIQLLRDNLRLWTSKLPPEDEETKLYCNSSGYYNATNEIQES